MYSASSLEDTYAHLSALEFDDLLDYDLETVNRGRLVTNLDYADGAANTIYAGQKDCVTGETLEQPGTYHFYVLNLGTDGMNGIGEADQTYTVNPSNQNFTLERSGGYDLSNYTVSYQNDAPDGLQKTLITGWIQN